MKYREGVPILILRPSIIICSYSEPVPGWTDSIAAAGALTLFFGLGALRYIVSNQTNRGDMIPVDFVSNAILVGTAF